MIFIKHKRKVLSINSPNLVGGKILVSPTFRQNTNGKVRERSSLEKYIKSHE